MSPEEFFMYLIIGLIVILPIGARLYRRIMFQRTQQMLRKQFDGPGSGKSGSGSRS